MDDYKGKDPETEDPRKEEQRAGGQGQEEPSQEHKALEDKRPEAGGERQEEPSQEEQGPGAGEIPKDEEPSAEEPVAEKPVPEEPAAAEPAAEEPIQEDQGPGPGVQGQEEPSQEHKAQEDQGLEARGDGQEEPVQEVPKDEIQEELDPEGEEESGENWFKGIAGSVRTFLYKIKFDPRKIKIDPAKIKKNYIWIILGVLVAALLLARTAGQIKNIITGIRGGKDKEMVEFAETIPVKVYKVKRMDFKDTIPVMGRIEGSREIDLKFETSGILESFNFEEGERILEGDIIASLDQRESLLKLKYAALEMEKAKKILELGGHDKIVYEQKKLEYESAKRDLEKTNIYAPTDGYLGTMEKHAGAYITPQDKIGMFVEYGKVYAIFDIIEEDSPKIKLGQNVDIFLDAHPGETYTGTVDMVSPMIEGRTRTQKIRVELDNEKDLMRPGMFARAVVNTYEKQDALIIPSSAFKKKEQKYFVYVVQKEEGEETEKTESPVEGEGEDAIEGETGIVEEREIKIEYLTHDMAEIGEGLEEGELIIRELHQEYKDKDKVEITEVQETIF